MKFLVTGKAEFYQYVEADTAQEAVIKLDQGEWHRTLNVTLEDIKVVEQITTEKVK